MRNFKIILLVTLVLGLGSLFLVSAMVKSPKKLRHVVAFKWKPEVTQQQMQQATADFHALKKKVPQILEFEGGPDVAYQKKTGKYTHCFIVTVKDEKDLAAYGVHPDHKAFSKSVDPLLAEVMVVDYWTE
jgi:Stress responsive A/B Barrel Domain